MVANIVWKLLRKFRAGATIMVNALGLIQVIKWTGKLLGLGEHVEFIVHIAHNLGEAGTVVEFLLNPPPALGLAIVLVGLILIWWQVRLNRHSALRSPDSPYINTVTR